jgi:hypothetical protein
MKNVTRPGEGLTQSVVLALAGAWPDLPEAEEVRADLGNI